MWKLAGQLFLAGATILGAGLCGGWWLSRSAVDPIARMTHTAEGIHASNLSQRIDLHNIDRELEQLGEVLNAMLSRLEQSFETQKRFAADASHELRTPLATMLSTIELSLSKERQPAEYQQHLLKCQRAAMRMHELVASLLQLTRSDANVTSHAFESVHLADVVGDVVDSLQDRAAARGIAIHCQLAPVQVQGRAGELTQVVTNLVQNAITYNRDGGSIEIRLAIEGSAALLQVRDTGVGIAAEHLPHVFERFYRVDKARTHSSGYGLGLAICQSIVQQHRGTISVTSQPQQGSEFSVRIPIGSTVLA
jgi:heavy metal sensor kinase